MSVDSTKQDLPSRLDAVFALNPTADAVGFEGRWYSYAALKTLGDTLAQFIARAGLEAGAPVGVLLRNRPAHFAAVLGLLRARFCLITVNPLSPPAALSKDIAALRLPVLVADREDWNQQEFLGAACASEALGISIDTRTAVLDIRLVEGMESIKGTHMQPGIAGIAGVAIEMLTSGTTGNPKRIRLDAHSFEHSLWAGSKYEAGNHGELALKRGIGIQWMPLVHIGGLFGAVYSIYNGRSFVLMERFDVETWHDLIVRYRPKFVNLPPSALHMVLERGYPKEDFAGLLAVRCGAAPLDRKLAVEFERRYAVPVLEGYGATEFAGGVAGWTLKDHQTYASTKRDSVGRPSAGVELRVVDPLSAQLLESGEVGLLEVKTPQIDAGRSWVRTTDIARLDAEGFLYILGRADNVIIRGGFKIMPAQVEAAIREHESVQDACVVGIADARLGQVPVAAIAPKPNISAPDEVSLKDFLRRLLKPYEIPVAFKFVGELPRTPSLKVNQVAIRAMFSQE